jgi:hypothetical protein
LVNAVPGHAEQVLTRDRADAVRPKLAAERVEVGGEEPVEVGDAGDLENWDETENKFKSFQFPSVKKLL